MAKKMSFISTLCATHPQVVPSFESPLDFHPFGNIHSFALIPIAIGMAIRLRVFLDWKQKPVFLSHKTILE